MHLALCQDTQRSSAKYIRTAHKDVYMFGKCICVLSVSSKSCLVCFCVCKSPSVLKATKIQALTIHVATTGSQLKVVRFQVVDCNNCVMLRGCDKHSQAWFHICEVAPRVDSDILLDDSYALEPIFLKLAKSR